MNTVMMLHENAAGRLSLISVFSAAPKYKKKRFGKWKNGFKQKIKINE